MLPALKTTVMSNDERRKHRALIVIKCKSMLARFYEANLDPVIRKEIYTGWVEALEDYEMDEINVACKRHLSETPNRRPHEGHIKAMIIKARGERIKRLPTIREPYSASEDRPEISDEDREARRKAADSIMKKFGFGK